LLLISEKGKGVALFVKGFLVELGSRYENILKKIERALELVGNKRGIENMRYWIVLEEIKAHNSFERGKGGERYKKI
jgi:hypothetical protein